MHNLAIEKTIGYSGTVNDVVSLTNNSQQPAPFTAELLRLRAWQAANPPPPPPSPVVVPAPTYTPVVAYVAPVQPTSDATPGAGLPAVMLAIMYCESGGRADAQNPSSTASGLFQFLDTTWNNYGGYSRAMYAPVSVQNAKALQEYNSAGTSPWLASESCWG